MTGAPERPPGRACPKCGSRRVQRSHRQGGAERLIALFGFRVRRCHGCNLRFATLGGSMLLVRHLEGILGRVYAALAALAIVIAATLFAVWFNVQQAAP